MSNKPEKKTKQQKYIDKVIAKHGNRFGLSKLIYIDSKTPVEIICEIHGSIWKNPSELLRDNGCKQCSHHNLKTPWDKLKEEFTIIHNDECDYTDSKYTGSKKLMDVRCKKHDLVYQITPANHKICKGCPSCRQEGYGSWLKLDKQEFIERAVKVHGNLYDYSESVYDGYTKQIRIRCKRHDKFFDQLVKNHLDGSGCPICARESIGKHNKKESRDFFVECNITHKNKFDYNGTEYTGWDKPISPKCPYHGEFTVLAGNHQKGTAGCPECSYVKSVGFEQEVVAYIRETLGVECRKSKSIMGNGQEVDVLITDRNIAFEMDGIYFHSELLGKDNMYHLNKTELCEKAGVTLYHIFEDEWYDKKDIVKAFILDKVGSKNLLGIPMLILSRPVITKEKQEEFVKENSLLESYEWDYNINLMQGESISCSLSINNDGEVIDCIKNKSFYGNEGIHTLLKYMKDNSDSPVRVRANRRLCGDMFKQYRLIGHTSPKEWYFKRSRVKRYTLEQLKKDVLKNESANMSEINDAGYYRIWDCGESIYEI